MRRIIEGSALGGPLRRGVRALRPGWHRAQRELRREQAAFLGHHAARIRSELAEMPCTRRALVVGYENPKMAAFQAPLIFALRVAGYHVTVHLASAVGAAADFYRAIGANAIFGTEDLGIGLDQRELRTLCAAASDPDSLLALAYRDIPIGRFVASTLMRRQRIGRIDPRAPNMTDAIAHQIREAVRAVEVALALVDRTAPDLVCFYDHGYTPDGELFEAALASGARAITLNAAHKSGYILSKRYGPANKDRHPGALSDETWQALQTLEWSNARWSTLRSEVEGAYRAGTWYDEVGTQFNKRFMTGPDLIRELGLDEKRKVAVVFPHLFWDATFFWGEDLFEDYRDWYCHVLKAAAANDRINWIVKIHPATLVKNARDGYVGEPAEVIAMRETLGELPPHIAILPPETTISTLSLYDVMDYCLTVRGTVGIEAAIFGNAVLTAGTGRYDGYGFTIDSRTREEYLARLGAIETLPKPTAAQTELARRYAYGLFVLRPLECSTMRFRYRHDEKATLELTLDLAEGCPIRDMSDIACLADWLAGSDDDLLGVTLEGGLGAERHGPRTTEQLTITGDR